MSERKPIPKRVRFEVFKRDSFRCQYCGREAPNVLLHVDHITPVSEGGTNDITNLITSCADCNLGKSNVALSDDAAIAKQKRQLDELQERREQLEMMRDWQVELTEGMLSECDIVMDVIRRTAGRDYPGLDCRKYLTNIILSFGLPAVCDAARLAFTQYTVDTVEQAEWAIGKLGGICYRKANNTCWDCVNYRGKSYYNDSVQCAAGWDHVYHTDHAQSCEDFERKQQSRQL